MSFVAGLLYVNMTRSLKIRKTKVSLVLALGIIVLSFSCQNKESPEAHIAHVLEQKIKDFIEAKEQLLNAVKNNNSQQKLQRLFLNARLAYKETEWATEYFAPLEAAKINGAPVPEIEVGDNPGGPPVVTQPKGLQIIEAILFPQYDTTNKEKLERELVDLSDPCSKIQNRLANVPILNWQIFDATKLEVFRIMTLGITGFDAPVSLNSIDEAKASLLGVQNAIASCQQNDSVKLLQTIDSATQYLEKESQGFNGFDRVRFIVDYLNPLSTQIDQLQTALHFVSVRYNRLLNQDAHTMFDTNAFNVNQYVASFDDTMTSSKVALGKALFYDPVLSENNVRSCASCHQPDKAFTDGLVRNSVFNSQKLLPRNTPTLINAALQPALFYDSRSTTVEDQAQKVIANKDEMHGNLEKSVSKLYKNPQYKVLFANAFPDSKSISSAEIQNALGSYVRSLVQLNSRFDDYMRGNRSAMTNNELHGFNLFMGKAKCGTCHYAPIFNGNVPPRFTKIESEIIGVPQSTQASSPIDPDLGRYSEMKDDFYKYAFKTPTLRNVARTAPYMHNGVFKTLEEVMDFYNKGGGRGRGIYLDNQTLPFEKLNLTPSEIKDIIAFMKSLDSR